jgi:hypothetical protein
MRLPSPAGAIRRVAVFLDRAEQGRQAPLGGGIVGFSNDVRASSSGANELVVEVSRSISSSPSSAAPSSGIRGPTSSSTITIRRQPSLAWTGATSGLRWSDLTQLAFLVAEAELAPRRQVAWLVARFATAVSSTARHVAQPAPIERLVEGQDQRDSFASGGPIRELMENNRPRSSDRD